MVRCAVVVRNSSRTSKPIHWELASLSSTIRLRCATVGFTTHCVCARVVGDPTKSVLSAFARSTLAGRRRYPGHFSWLSCGHGVRSSGHPPQTNHGCTCGCRCILCRCEPAYPIPKSAMRDTQNTGSSQRRSGPPSSIAWQ